MATMLTAIITTAKSGVAAVAGGGGGSLGTILSVGGSIASGLASIAAGNARASALESQAEVEDFRAKQELIKGREEVVKSLELLNDDLAAMTVAGYAAGLQPSGSVEAAKNDAIEAGEFSVATARDNADVASGMRRTSARNLRQDAKSARSGGIWGALTAGLTYGARTLRRG